MDAKKKIMIVTVIAVVILAVIVFAGYEWRTNTPATSTNPAPASSSNSGVTAAPASSVVTRTSVPANTVVPDKGATGTPANVAVPAVQGPGDSAGNVSYRSFNIKIENNAFSPSTVIVKQGDTVNISLTAVDGNYGFTQPDYGFNAPIAKGQTKNAQFQVLQSGDFLFYCGSCGGPSKGPVGHIIVTAN
jgi:heme/copper-type cytochrome/quinol oxidase subunit 2